MANVRPPVFIKNEFHLIKATLNERPVRGFEVQQAGTQIRLNQSLGAEKKHYDDLFDCRASLSNSRQDAQKTNQSL